MPIIIQWSIYSQEFVFSKIELGASSDCGHLRDLFIGSNEKHQHKIIRKNTYPCFIAIREIFIDTDFKAID